MAGDFQISNAYEKKFEIFFCVCVCVEGGEEGEGRRKCIEMMWYNI